MRVRKEAAQRREVAKRLIGPRELRHEIGGEIKLARNPSREKRVILSGSRLCHDDTAGPLRCKPSRVHDKRIAGFLVIFRNLSRHFVRDHILTRNTRNVLSQY